jgi:hypothetical protein
MTESARVDEPGARVHAPDLLRERAAENQTALRKL